MRMPALLFALASLAAAPLVMPTAAQAPASAAADVQLQLGDLLAADARFGDAVDAYERALAAAGGDAALARRARAGLASALLRTGDAGRARMLAEALTVADPRDASAHALYGDTLWAFGLFDEAAQA